MKFSHVVHNKIQAIIENGVGFTAGPSSAPIASFGGQDASKEITLVKKKPKPILIKDNDVENRK